MDYFCLRPIIHLGLQVFSPNVLLGCRLPPRIAHRIDPHASFGSSPLWQLLGLSLCLDTFEEHWCRAEGPRLGSCWMLSRDQTGRHALGRRPVRTINMTSPLLLTLTSWPPAMLAQSRHYSPCVSLLSKLYSVGLSRSARIQGAGSLVFHLSEVNYLPKFFGAPLRERFVCSLSYLYIYSISHSVGASAGSWMFILHSDSQIFILYSWLSPKATSWSPSRGSLIFPRCQYGAFVTLWRGRAEPAQVIDFCVLHSCLVDMITSKLFTGTFLRKGWVFISFSARLILRSLYIFYLRMCQSILESLSHPFLKFSPSETFLDAYCTF